MDADEAKQRRISSRCPSCNNATLFIDNNGFIVCSWIECKDPTAITGARHRIATLQSDLNTIKRKYAELDTVFQRMEKAKDAKIAALESKLEKCVQTNIECVRRLDEMHEQRDKATTAFLKSESKLEKYRAMRLKSAASIEWPLGDPEEESE